MLGVCFLLEVLGSTAVCLVCLSVCVFNSMTLQLSGSDCS